VTGAVASLQLTPDQERAVELATREFPPVMVITGGPGTGKSTVLRSILDDYRAQGLRTVLMAPSGKAAVRMREATGRSAYTIHSALGLFNGGLYKAGGVELADAAIVDESSMVDSRVMAAVFENTQHVRTLILVGDADQLPPVQEGCPFLDLVRSGLVPTVRLTHVHRQAAESGIIRAAHQINRGRSPEWSDDFAFVACEEADEVPATVARVIRERQLRPEAFQVLSPQKTRAAGVNNLNAFLESQRGTKAPLLRERFRAGTRVIQTTNDYELGVMNGEQGFVVRVEAGQRPAQDQLWVRFDQGAEHHYQGGKIRSLQPAWAVTCHKSQGSQWDTVIFVAHKSVGFLLSRSLLYVAVTRAERQVVVVGQQAAVDMAVRKVRDVRRRTLLGLWLARERGAA